MLEQETKTVVIHVGIMVSITIFFIIYFGEVEKSQELKNQIIENISTVPIGQLLAYEGYFGYVFLKIIRHWQEKIKLKRTLSNAVVLGGILFHVYATWVLDLIAITVITFEFFVYSIPEALPDALKVVKVSDLLFITILPSLVIVSHLLLRKTKLEKR